MESRAYFGALLLNKHCQRRLTSEQTRLERQRKLVYSWIWQQKEMLMDDFVHINVRTPSPLKTKAFSAISDHSKADTASPLKTKTFSTVLHRPKPQTPRTLKAKAFPKRSDESKHQTQSSSQPKASLPDLLKSDSPRPHASSTVPGLQKPRPGTTPPGRRASLASSSGRRQLQSEDASGKNSEVERCSPSASPSRPHTSDAVEAARKPSSASVVSGSQNKKSALSTTTTPLTAVLSTPQNCTGRPNSSPGGLRLSKVSPSGVSKRRKVQSSSPVKQSEPSSQAVSTNPDRTVVESDSAAMHASSSRAQGDSKSKLYQESGGYGDVANADIVRNPYKNGSQYTVSSAEDNGPASDDQEDDRVDNTVPNVNDDTKDDTAVYTGRSDPHTTSRRNSQQSVVSKVKGDIEVGGTEDSDPSSNINYSRQCQTRAPVTRDDAGESHLHSGTYENSQNSLVSKTEEEKKERNTFHSITPLRKPAWQRQHLVSNVKENITQDENTGVRSSHPHSAPPHKERVPQNQNGMMSNAKKESTEDRSINAASAPPYRKLAPRSQNSMVSNGKDEKTEDRHINAASAPPHRKSMLQNQDGMMSNGKEESTEDRNTNAASAPAHKKPARHLTLDPKLVLPLTAKRYQCRKQATIVPVIAVHGQHATLYPNTEAKAGRVVTLDRRARGWIARSACILSLLDKVQDRLDGADVALQPPPPSPPSSPSSLSGPSGQARPCPRRSNESPTLAALAGPPSFLLGNEDGVTCVREQQSGVLGEHGLASSHLPVLDVDGGGCGDDADDDDDAASVVLVPQTIYAETEAKQYPGKALTANLKPRGPKGLRGKNNYSQPNRAMKTRESLFVRKTNPVKVNGYH